MPIRTPDAPLSGARLVLTLVITAAISLSAAPGSPAIGAETADVSVSLLRGIIDRFAEDLRALERRYDFPTSATRSERLRKFYEERMEQLKGIDFEALELDGRIDHILLQNEIRTRLRDLDHEKERVADISRLIPFAPVILRLEEARRRFEAVDSPGSARILTDLARDVEALRKSLEGPASSDKNPAGPAPTRIQARRAAMRVDDLAGTLKRWYRFHSEYDPEFTWWMQEPYQQADKRLREYADHLRKRIAGFADGQDEPILGDPIGREALLDALRSEMIPYTPEELIDIANTEFAWCEAEYRRAARDMGCGDDWRKALELVKTKHVKPGEQPKLIRDLALEAEKFLEDRNLVTIPPLCKEIWRMEMMSPERQKVNPFFTGGEVITVSFPTAEMSHEDKLMSLRGNNIHFSRATVQHELIPGHHLQGFMGDRYNAHRSLFRTPFLVEGWALYWELLLWDLNFPRSPEDRIGMLFWRSHRCARIIFSLNFHLGKMTAAEAIDFLVERVGHERANATGEVRRSVSGDYPPLYQAAYLLGGLQLRALRRELVESGKLSDREFHDGVLRENTIPIEMIRASLSRQTLSRDFASSWKFYSAKVAASPRVYRDRIEPRWIEEGSKFWYRVRTAGGKEETVLVDATAGKREVVEGAERIAALEASPTRETGRRRRPRPERAELPSGGIPSPDKALVAFVRGDNLVIRDAASGQETPLTQDGTSADTYHRDVIRDRAIGLNYQAPDAPADMPEAYWSPDSKYLVAMRTRTAAPRQVYLVDSSPGDQRQPRLQTYPYFKPGDEIPIEKPHLFDAREKRQIPIGDGLFPTPWSIDSIRWRADSSRFTFLYNQRGHQVLRIIEVDAKSGAARSVVDESCPTFIDYAGKFFAELLDGSGEIIWMSERDGWNHLYLYDAASGKVKNQITRGDWVVRRVEFVDPEARQIVFIAGGIRPDQDPYFQHYCRIGFDGNGLVQLTDADGSHQAEFSPDRKFFIDTWSRVDSPPVIELRQAGDGRLVCRLEEADASELLGAGWRPPERFDARGRDGVTGIYGIIHRPRQFNPAAVYPVIESIYAGPHGSHVPKSFRSSYSQEAIANLGFIVVQIDGMGTSNRSKKFHDVCWKNLGDAGFPDRIAWMRAAAAKFPFMDISRVGVYGGSAGGQNALRALLAYGDFYKAAAADCGCHDNRMDKIWWNELWMGWPIGPHYDEQSNSTQAHKLKGDLLLTVGELDRNVDPSSTYQVAKALIKANKDFEMIVVPGAGHGAGETPYCVRRRAEFFIRRLQGREPVHLAEDRVGG